MLLAIDMGNTQTALGLFDGGELVHSWRMPTDRSFTADELHVRLHGYFHMYGMDLDVVDAMAFAGVVPQLNRAWSRVAERLGARTVVVGPDTASVTCVRAKNPAEVGADRIANATAAAKFYGSPSIVVDFGTATKILAVDRDGLFLGGSILPGIPSFPKVLFQKADLLPDMSLTDENVPLLSLKTEECIASGAIHGTTFLVEGYLKRLQQRKGLEGAQVLFTGGNFHYVERNLANKGKYVRTLPLLGLKKAFSL